MEPQFGEPDLLFRSTLEASRGGGHWRQGSDATLMSGDGLRSRFDRRVSTRSGDERSLSDSETVLHFLELVANLDVQRRVCTLFFDVLFFGSPLGVFLPSGCLGGLLGGIRYLLPGPGGRGPLHCKL